MSDAPTPSAAVDPNAVAAPFIPVVQGRMFKPAEDTPADAVVPRTIVIDRQISADGARQPCAQFIFTGTEANAIELLDALTKASEKAGVRIISAGGW